MCERLDSSEILTDFWTILDLHESLPFPIPFPLKMTFTFCHGFLLINSEPPLLRCRMVLLHTPGSYDAVYLHFLNTSYIAWTVNNAQKTESNYMLYFYSVVCNFNEGIECWSMNPCIMPL